ncbi:hypothetical protein BDA99DRAFT_538902 [Phascolomyces articulosus]|uniref:Uncharacterized protein n=1 Tax=Phascolomyces articulosus TaxID=60185 RepID=A0AAD5PCZ7_9FUNG|nr:hypothetical protein BDA99DRAFT_538902 [Phascolomyces articulosus]
MPLDHGQSDLINRTILKTSHMNLIESLHRHFFNASSDPLNGMLLLSSLEHEYDLEKETILLDIEIINEPLIHSQPYALYDLRAHANALHCQSEAASADAQEMIQCAPQIATGYILKGNILSMYGHQKKAIDDYTTGLQRIQSTRDYSTTANEMDIQK